MTFFVVGFPRSGTTLLSVLLDRHSRLCVTPETAFFDEVAPQLRANDDARLGIVLRKWRRLPELRLDAEHVIAQLPRPWTPSDVLRAILDLYAEAHAKPRCGEKTPQHLNHADTILRHFDDAKILCLVRDGRDAVLSLRAMPWFRGSLAATAKMWKESVRIAEEHARKQSNRFTIVRYEDLIASPHEHLALTMHFIGESFEPRQLDTSVASDVVLPRSMEWKGRALGPITADAQSRRESARAEDVAYLDRVLHDDLQRLGY
ncbi:MAG TPA: sulfotransferase [Thermoanaerobaculia bacterium]|nr:sulfotransferase [Thermoanaerobaculia bacterium]